MTAAAGAFCRAVPALRRSGEPPCPGVPDSVALLVRARVTRHRTPSLLPLLPLFPLRVDTGLGARHGWAGESRGDGEEGSGAMDDAASLWVRDTTLGAKAREFWWRVDEEGSLTIRRVESRRKRPRAVAERTLSANDLDRLDGLLGDGAWHPLASGAQAARAGVEEAGLGVFLHRELGWNAQSTVVASHVAAVMAGAGL